MHFICANKIKPSCAISFPFGGEGPFISLGALHRGVESAYDTTCHFIIGAIVT